jgi:hypothetical protein
VWAAVVAGKDFALVEEQGDVLAAEFYCDGAGRLQAVEIDCAGPLGDGGG